MLKCPEVLNAQMDLLLLEIASRKMNIGLPFVLILSSSKPGSTSHRLPVPSLLTWLTIHGLVRKWKVKAPI